MKVATTFKRNQLLEMKVGTNCLKRIQPQTVRVADKMTKARGETTYAASDLSLRLARHQSMKLQKLDSLSQVTKLVTKLVTTC